jgi:hypothetical protein
MIFKDVKEKEVNEGKNINLKEFIHFEKEKYKTNVNNMKNRFYFISQCKKLFSFSQKLYLFG